VIRKLNDASKDPKQEEKGRLVQEQLSMKTADPAAEPAQTKVQNQGR